MTLYDDKTIARFWSKVARRGPDDCWDWTASRVTDGYGEFRLNKPRRKCRTHVFSYEIHKGTTNGLYVCHSCDRPPCCNPAHLWLGTNRDNINDLVAKGLFVVPDRSGEKNGRAILTETNIREIRTLITNGMHNTTIADRFGVTHSMISRIRLGKSWKHLDG